MSAASLPSIRSRCARASPAISEVHFTDGQMVKKGDLLFAIDQRPFQIALDQMRANLAQARANLDFHRSRSARAASNWCATRPSPSRSSTSARRRSAVRRPAAAAQEAMVRQAELDLEFTDLRAPIDGRIGDRRVSPGNLVTGGNGRQHHAARDHRLGRSDPLRIHLRRGLLSALPALRRQGRRRWPTAKAAFRSRSSSSTRQEFEHAGRDGFRRQRHRPLLGHDPRPRRLRQSRRTVHARNVRPHPRPRLAAHTRRCSFPMPRSAPSRSRKYVLVSMATVSRGRNT